MSTPEGRGQFGISEVLVQLRPEFPEKNNSKLKTRRIRKKLERK